MPVALESFSPVSRTFPTGFKEPMAETYYCPHDLPRFAEMGKDRPELWAKFLDYYNAVFADGALTAREKALIALGVAHAVQCPYCIDAYQPVVKGRPACAGNGRVGREQVAA
jgi:alkylhydroperoxidase/carboxymuconolactone decarboxylase family protein YurZ